MSEVSQLCGLLAVRPSLLNRAPHPRAHGSIIAGYDGLYIFTDDFKENTPSK